MAGQGGPRGALPEADRAPSCRPGHLLALVYADACVPEPSGGSSVDGRGASSRSMLRHRPPQPVPCGAPQAAAGTAQEADWPRLAAPSCRPGHLLALVKPRACRTYRVPCGAPQAAAGTLVVGEPTDAGSQPTVRRAACCTSVGVCTPHAIHSTHTARAHTACTPRTVCSE